MKVTPFERQQRYNARRRELAKIRRLILNTQPDSLYRNCIYCGRRTPKPAKTCVEHADLLTLEEAC